MPSKAELKQEIDTLRASLKDTTKRLTAVESRNPELLPSGERARLPSPKCDLYISKIESEIAAGKSYWDITEEQYERWVKGEDRCLPCEREYTEAKESLMEIGERYRNLVRPEDAVIESIAESLREDSTRELYKAEAHIKTASASCSIKFPRVRARLLKMKPLAHVGRWDEFMDNQRQLLTDLEQDIQAVIPNLKVMIPSYAVPRYVEKIEKIVPRKPTPEEEKGVEETKRLAALARKARGGV